MILNRPADGRKHKYFYPDGSLDAGLQRIGVRAA
jgi:hypothetical protein